MSSTKLHRREYKRGKLHRRDLLSDPIDQFRRWYADAAENGHLDPAAMTLATAGPDGTPNARMVLLKSLDDRGFVFCTHYDSPKGRELQANPRAVLVFYWPEVERQVRVSGTARWLSESENAEFFHSRPKDAQVAATLGQQSMVVESREDLERRFAKARSKLAGDEVPPPKGWGAFAVVPDAMEFWQGGLHRLHDRLLYRRTGDEWRIDRIMP